MVDDETPAREGSRGRTSQGTQLVGLALESGVKLFHTPDAVAFACVPVGEHREVWPIRGPGFRLWLQRLFFTATERTPNAQAMQDALATLEAVARFEGLESPVYTRLAEHEGRLYLDLADDAWLAVEVGPDGWRIVNDPPVRFRRPRGMLPLPIPIRGARLDRLRDFLNVADDGWVLTVAWLVGTLRPDQPFPLLGLHGEQGSGKSTQARMLRGLVDPNLADLRSAPRDEHDLILAAHNGWVIGLDNLSHFPPWLSDALCRLSTGAGFACRLLYSDAEEALFAAKRPILFTSIEEIAVRGDLADRTIVVHVPAIGDHARRTEETLMAAYEHDRPQLLGALLDVVVAGLRALPDVEPVSLPRMADFARWVAAAEPAIGWAPGAFQTAYGKNRETARDATLEASPIAGPLIKLVEERGEWTGIAKELLAELSLISPGQHKPPRDWPASPRALRGALERVLPDLRAVGVTVTFARGTKRQRSRLIEIRRRPSNTVRTVQPSIPSDPGTSGAGHGADPHADGGGDRPSTGGPFKIESMVGVDGSDGQLHRCSSLPPRR